MILKRLKLFTIYVDPNGVAATDQQLRSIANGGAVNNAGQLGLPDYTNKQNGTNAPANPKPGSNASTSAAPVDANNAGGAKSVSVMGGTKAAVPLKDANARVTFDPNNVKLDKDAFNNSRIESLTKQNSQLQSQLDAANKAKVESAARGRVAGRKQVGVWQGLQNTWNKAGTMKKIGMGGAALAGTYFLGKGLLGGNNNNDQ